MYHTGTHITKPSQQKLQLVSLSWSSDTASSPAEAISRSFPTQALKSLCATSKHRHSVSPFLLMHVDILQRLQHHLLLISLSLDAHRFSWRPPSTQVRGVSSNFTTWFSSPDRKSPPEDPVKVVFANVWGACSLDLLLSCKPTCTSTPHEVVFPSWPVCHEKLWQTIYEIGATFAYAWALSQWRGSSHFPIFSISLNSLTRMCP